VLKQPAVALPIVFVVPMTMVERVLFAQIQFVPTAFGKVPPKILEYVPEMVPAKLGAHVLTTLQEATLWSSKTLNVGIGYSFIS